MKKIVFRAAVILAGLCVTAVSFIGFGALWGLSTWGKLDIDEIVFQLQNPLKGTESGILISYAVRGFLPAAVLIVLYVIIVRKIRNERIRTYFAAGVFAASVMCAAAVGRYVWTQLNAGEWIEGRKNKSSFIEEHYVRPDSSLLKYPEKKRNLVFIYLESMEVTYADREAGGDFSENVIPELTQIALENECFNGGGKTLNGGISYPGTTFTTGAIFAETTGLPLKIGIGGKTGAQDPFFPGVTALGDILEEAGYRRLFLLGSDASFGGRRRYFRDHGDYEIMDYTYAKEQGWIQPDYKVWWGYEDEKLFSFARETVKQASEGEEPFCLTILTVDTHFQDGYVCRLCGDAFPGDRYANVIACCSRQTAEFLSWLKEQDCYDNTTVIVSGDHPTMDNDFCENVDDDYLRTTYTAVINAAAEPADPSRTRSFSTMDIFPTTLAAMGVEIEGERLGLGTNLFSGTETLTEKYGREFLQKELTRRSLFLEKLEKTDAE